jgi:hypothetical protein
MMATSLLGPIPRPTQQRPLKPLPVKLLSRRVIRIAEARGRGTARAAKVLNGAAHLIIAALARALLLPRCQKRLLLLALQKLKW